MVQRQHGSYKQTGVLLLVDMETLVSKEWRVEINLCLWTLWAATSVVLKPWADRVGVHRMENGSDSTSLQPPYPASPT